MTTRAANKESHMGDTDRDGHFMCSMLYSMRKMDQDDQENVWRHRTKLTINIVLLASFLHKPGNCVDQSQVSNLGSHSVTPG